MKRAWKIMNLIVLMFLITICLLGTFHKHISFGLGLGDIFGYGILYLVTIFHIGLTLSLRNKGISAHIILGAVFFIFAVLICLKATLWRGPLYKWNGHIFYTSPKS
ncbi:ABC-type transport system involved in multi-copper enzyme maturation permease subunit [Chryseobacterium defluvii]|uniref:ABC-type transport system involved in multi-copper enzyme maturation permease subunit n=1 Tax=Chryseobacterium defluvii TaxID=160396 RepID=A0A840KBL0_9FLAO|nr:hypothetical protein [Chryseobacterium defluvii]MBB4805184.1 ABC-type transport system involved in multi-copper enzyme maturation permease subunit [Chryseobacterium defluvii]